MKREAPDLQVGDVYHGQTVLARPRVYTNPTVYESLRYLILLTPDRTYKLVAHVQGLHNRTGEPNRWHAVPQTESVSLCKVVDLMRDLCRARRCERVE